MARGKSRARRASLIDEASIAIDLLLSPQQPTDAAVEDAGRERETDARQAPPNRDAAPEHPEPAATAYQRACAENDAKIDAALLRGQAKAGAPVITMYGHVTPDSTPSLSQASAPSGGGACASPEVPRNRNEALLVALHRGQVIDYYHIWTYNPRFSTSLPSTGARSAPDAPPMGASQRFRRPSHYAPGRHRGGQGSVITM